MLYLAICRYLIGISYVISSNLTISDWDFPMLYRGICPYLIVHINRIERIFSILKDFGFKVQIKNENDSIDNTADIVLVNYYGAVSKYLK